MGANASASPMRERAAMAMKFADMEAKMAEANAAAASEGAARAATQPVQCFARGDLTFRGLTYLAAILFSGIFAGGPNFL